MKPSKSLDVGDQAPEFTLPGKDSSTVSLSDYLGERAVVLYFYPKDETPGCTAEACQFRDSYEVFTDAGAEVIGISADSVDSHENFSTNHNLPFVLASDVDGEVRKQYGVRAVIGLLPGRVTFVIDRDGVVRHVFSSMTDINGHVDGALEVVKDLQGSA